MNKKSKDREKLREEIEAELLKHPDFKDVVLEHKKMKREMKKTESDQDFYTNVFAILQGSIAKLGGNNALKSQSDLMIKNTETVFMLADAMGSLLEKMQEKDNSDLLGQLEDVKKLLKQNIDKRIPAPIVKVEAPNVEIPQPVVIDKSTIIQETEHIQKAVDVLQRILHQVSTKQSDSVYIRNEDPEQAIPVRFVDSMGKRFVDMIQGVISAGGGARSSAAEKKDSTDAVAGSEFGLIGAVADETSPSTVTEGKWGWLRMTLQRFLYVTLGTLISGESQTKNRMLVEYSYSYTNIITATTTVVVTGSGHLKGLMINKAVAAGVITIYDNTAASGTKIATITYGAALLSDPPYPALFDVDFGTGLTIVTSAAFDLTAITRDDA